MLDDLAGSVRQEIRERFDSPILVSFAISWCLWNYKFLVILFSSASVTTTFELIRIHSFPDYLTVLTHGLILPVVTAALYLFAYPYPAIKVFGFLRRMQNRKNRLLQQIQDERLLSAEESRLIAQSMRSLQKAHSEEVNALSLEITGLKAELERAGLSKGTSRVGYKDMDPVQAELLLMLDREGPPMTIREVVEKSGLPRTDSKFNIDELVRIGLLESYEGNQGQFVDFSHEGRRAVIELKKLQLSSDPDRRAIPVKAAKWGRDW